MFWKLDSFGTLTKTAAFFLKLLYSFGSWLLMFCGLTPISLLVTLELVKFL